MVKPRNPLHVQFDWSKYQESLSQAEDKVNTLQEEFTKKEREAKTSEQRFETLYSDDFKLSEAKRLLEEGTRDLAALQQKNEAKKIALQKELDEKKAARDDAKKELTDKYQSALLEFKSKESKLIEEQKQNEQKKIEDEKAHHKKIETVLIDQIKKPVTLFTNPTSIQQISPTTKDKLRDLITKNPIKDENDYSDRITYLIFNMSQENLSNNEMKISENDIIQATKVFYIKICLSYLRDKMLEKGTFDGTVSNKLEDLLKKAIYGNNVKEFEAFLRDLRKRKILDSKQDDKIINLIKVFNESNNIKKFDNLDAALKEFKKKEGNTAFGKKYLPNEIYISPKDDNNEYQRKVAIFKGKTSVIPNDILDSNEASLDINDAIKSGNYKKVTALLESLKKQGFINEIQSSEILAVITHLHNMVKKNQDHQRYLQNFIKMIMATPPNDLLSKLSEFNSPNEEFNQAIRDYTAAFKNTIATHQGSSQQLSTQISAISNEAINLTATHISNMHSQEQQAEEEKKSMNSTLQQLEQQYALQNKQLTQQFQSQQNVVTEREAHHNAEKKDMDEKRAQANSAKKLLTEAQTSFSDLQKQEENVLRILKANVLNGAAIYFALKDTDKRKDTFNLNKVIRFMEKVNLAKDLDSLAKVLDEHMKKSAFFKIESLNTLIMEAMYNSDNGEHKGLFSYTTPPLPRIEFQTNNHHDKTNLNSFLDGTYDGKIEDLLKHARKFRTDNKISKPSGDTVKVIEYQSTRFWSRKSAGIRTKGQVLENIRTMKEQLHSLKKKPGIENK